MTLERRRRTDWVAFIAFGLVVATFVVGLKLNHDTGREADRKIRAAAIERAEQIEAEARKRTAQIEESRREVLIRSCREVNRRHDSTIRGVDKLLADRPPAQRAESRASTVFLIERILPHRDCAKRAARLIKP